MLLGEHWFGVASYAVAAIGYGAATLLLMMNHPGGRRASLLAIATAFSFLWAVCFAALLLSARPSVSVVVSLDAVHLFVWIICVLPWLEGFSSGRWLATAAAVAGCLAIGVSLPAFQNVGLAWMATPAMLGMTVVGLLVAEQVLRNSREEQRRHLRLLCLATGGIFLVDVFVYAETALLRGLVSTLWDARGFANAALLPLIVLAAKRQREWERGLFVSRQVAFYTASLLAVGAYLLAMGFVAYALAYFDRAWNLGVTLLFMSLAAALPAFIFHSASLRRRVRTFLVKHFYRNKYDYRLEWLRLTQSLGRSGDLGVLAGNGLDALAQIAGSKRGQLWLARDPHRYELMASSPAAVETPKAYDGTHPVVQFLAKRAWVIDSAEYGAEPDRYQNAFGDVADGALPPNSIIVPLDCQGTLQGFVILENPTGAGALDFEDHDILKTAGKQVAVALAQAIALEKLTETRQFEAMNKMSTFLMHDLKNILAQQQLVVSNAARFKQRPEFIDDAIATVRAGADRMRYVLEQLEGSRSKPSASGRADISKVLIEVRSRCSDRKPVPEVDCSATGLWVPVDRERLTSVITHLVRNAQDATPLTGDVRIAASASGGQVVCTVADTGCGMDQLFVRDRLFRPFDSTKGVSGMGIGAYQVRELVRAAGGDVDVASAPGTGTTFTLRFPFSDAGIETARPSAAANLAV